MIKQFIQRQAKEKIIIVMATVMMVLSLQIVYADTQWSNPVQSDFTGTGTKFICSQSENTASWDKYEEGVGWTRVDARVENCKKDVDTVFGSTICCPSELNPVCQWEDEEAENYLDCIPGDLADVCADYATPARCGNYAQQVADADMNAVADANDDLKRLIVKNSFCDQENPWIKLLPSGNLMTFKFCKCFWDDAETETAKCKSSYEVDVSDLDGDFFDGTCAWSQENIQGDCNVAGTEFITVDLKALWVWINTPPVGEEGDYTDPLCIDTSGIVYCTSIIELDFFDITSLVLALILLSILYYFVIRQKKKYAGKISKPKKKSKKKKRK